MKLRKLRFPLLLLPALLLCSCFDFNNPIDPTSHDFIGYLTVNEANLVKPEWPVEGLDINDVSLLCSNFIDAEFYHFQVSESETNFVEKIVFEVSDALAHEIDVYNLEAETDYFWRVRAKGNDWGEWSETATFTFFSIANR